MLVSFPTGEFLRATAKGKAPHARGPYRRSTSRLGYVCLRRSAVPIACPCAGAAVRGRRSNCFPCQGPHSHST